MDELRLALGSILATGSAVRGEAQVKRRGEPYWEAVEVGAVFWPGDWVRTGAGGHLRVSFARGGWLELDPEAVAVLDQQPPAAPDGAGEPLLAVASGVVRTFVAAGPDGAPPTALHLRTPDGAEARLVSTSPGSDLMLRLSSTGATTEISVDAGEATLAHRGDEQRLEPGQGAALASGRLTALEILPAPALVGPGPDAHLALESAETVQLDWKPVSGATGYRVHISPDPSFRAPELALTEGPGHALAPTSPGLHVWRVAARDPQGRYGRWTAPRRFFVVQPGAPDALERPEAGARFGHSGSPPRIRFSWRGPEEGSYRLLVARSAQLMDAPVVDARVATLVHEDASLEPGEYWWGVFRVDRGMEPLFPRPRPLTVRALPLETLKVIRDWGDR